MQIKSLGLPEIKIIQPKYFTDARGFFSETYNMESFSKFGLHKTFVQDNHSFSKDVGVVRGLHYQIPPFAQDKLVRVVKGRIWDVAVDIRPNSKTYLQWVHAEISADNWSQILVPKGFAHGFMTLEKNTEVIYKVSNFYNPECDRALKWNDPQIGIKWPMDEKKAILSEKDENAQVLSKVEDELLRVESEWNSL